MKPKVYFSRQITPEKVLELYRLTGAELGVGSREYELIEL